MEQLDLFDLDREEKIKSHQEQMFREWEGLPDEKLIPADSPERPRVQSELSLGYCRRWKQALHRCNDLPADKYIWLNEVEPGEFWVINDVGNPAGEHIEICPFCGADLKHRGGDVVLVKADDGWWRILGYIKEEKKDG